MFKFTLSSPKLLLARLLLLIHLQVRATVLLLHHTPLLARVIAQLLLLIPLLVHPIHPLALRILQQARLIRLPVHHTHPHRHRIRQLVLATGSL